MWPPVAIYREKRKKMKPKNKENESKRKEERIGFGLFSWFFWFFGFFVALPFDYSWTYKYKYEAIFVLFFLYGFLLSGIHRKDIMSSYNNTQRSIRGGYIFLPTQIDSHADKKVIVDPISFLCNHLKDFHEEKKKKPSVIIPCIIYLADIKPLAVISYIKRSPRTKKAMTESFWWFHDSSIDVTDIGIVGENKGGRDL